MAQVNPQKTKLIALLRMLERETDLEQGLTMAQIIEKLAEQGISAERKSIYRDIDTLRACGYDIHTLPRRPVEYAMSRTELNLSDVMLLIDAVQSTRFLTQRKSDQLVKNLKHLVSEREAKQLDKHIHVSGRIKSQTDSVFNNVDIIHAALQKRRQITFEYFKYNTALKRSSRNNGALYETTPVKLIYADGFYYLVTFNEKYDDFTVYRVDRMRLIQISDKPAVRNSRIASYDYSGFERESFGMFSGEQIHVTLRAKPGLMDVIADRFGVKVSVLESTEEYADVRVAVRKSAQFFGWIAGLDGGVTIQSPKHVREEYRDWLKSLMNNA